MSAEGGTKAVVAALLANTGIAVTKFGAWLLTGASSMLAESIHSVADAGNQALLVLGGRRARRDATPPFTPAARAPRAQLDSYIRNSRSPELPVLLLEDSGALLGLVFATCGIALALLTGNPVFDGVGTLAIGALLVAIAIVLAIEMKSLLIGEAATPDVVRRIEAEIAQEPAVRRVIHMLTQHLGPDELLVAAKVEFDSALSMGDLAGAIDACEARVRSAVPIARVIYLEPGLLVRSDPR